MEEAPVGSQHFDRLRKEEEEAAQEEVARKNQELQAAMINAFDDILDSTVASETSSYFKPPQPTPSSIEVDLRDVLEETKRQLEELRRNNDLLESLLDDEKRKVDVILAEKLSVEESLNSAKMKIRVLEEDIGELSDSHNIHRIKDQYDNIIKNLKASFDKDRLQFEDLVSSLRKEVETAKMHVCPKSTLEFQLSKLNEENTKLMNELEEAKSLVEDLRQKELELQLLLTDKSMELRAGNLPRSMTSSPIIDESVQEKIFNLCRLLNVDNTQIDSPVTALNKCAEVVLTIKDDFSKTVQDVEKSKKICQDLRLAASALERENANLKEKMEHQNSDTESQTDVTKIGKIHLEKLEAENNRLKGRLEQLSEEKDKLRSELKNYENQSHRTALSNEDLANECRGLRERLNQANEVYIDICRQKDEIQRMLEQDKVCFQEKIDQLTDEINLKEKEIEAMRVKFAAEKRSIEETMSTKLMDQCASLIQKKATALLEAKEQEMRKCIEEERKNVRLLKEQVERLTSEVANTNEESSSTRAELEARLLNCNEEVCDLRQQLTQTSQKLKLKEAECTDVKNLLEEFTKTLKKKEAAVAQLTSKINDLELEKECMVDRQKFQLARNTIKDLQKKVEVLQKASSDSKQRDQDIEKLRQQIELLTNQVQQVEDDKRKFTETLKQLEKQKEDITKDASRNEEILKSNYEALQREIKICEDENASLKDQLRIKVNTMSKVMEDLKILRQSGQEYSRERKKLLEKMNTLEQDLSLTEKREHQLKYVLSSVTDKMIDFVGGTLR